MNRPNLLFAATLMFIVAAAFIAINRLPGGELVIKDADTGTEYARFPLENGQGFSITFIHSVSQSPYTDYYLADSRGIYLAGARYYAFGAGVEPGLGQELEFDDDGSLYIGELETELPRLVYYLGVASDYTLGINGAKHSLIHICGTNKALAFGYE